MKRRYAVLGVLALAGATTYLLSDDDPPAGAPAEPPYVTIFMVDGLSQEVFAEELAAGRLPNVQRLVDDGLYVEHGVSSFPSMTGYGFYPMLTGEDATESGVLGLRWFDRTRAYGNFRSYVGRTNVQMNEDLVERPTIFERFAPAHSMTINSYNNRGAVHSVKTGFKFTAAKYEGHWWVADLLSSIPFYEEELSPDWRQIETYAVDLLVADLEHRPKVQWVTFVSPDTYAHVNGIGPRYAELVRMVDDMVGAYREKASEMGLDEDRIYAFVSDHGVEDVKHNVQLVDELAESGITAWRGDATVLFSAEMQDTFEDFAEADVLIAINGNLMSYLYVRDPTKPGGAGWAERPTLEQMRSYGPKQVDLVATLLTIEGIEHVIVRGDGAAEVHGKDGVGRITTSSSGFAYDVVGTDPFGYAASAPELVDGRIHSAEDWLAGTHATDYPYAVVRTARLLAQDGAGDLVITSAPYYDLAKDFEMFVGNYHGGHGGLRAAQMVVPYVLAGPGVPHGRFAASAAEDIGATLLELLGVDTSDVFGRPLEVDVTRP